LAAKLRAAMANRPELQNALEEARKTIDTAPEEKDEKQADEKEAAEKEEPEDEEDAKITGEDNKPWPPERIRFTKKALAAGAAAAKALESAEHPEAETLVEAAALATLEVMKAGNKLPTEARIPEKGTGEKLRKRKAEEDAQRKEAEALAAAQSGKQASSSSTADPSKADNSGSPSGPLAAPGEPLSVPPGPLNLSGGPLNLALPGESAPSAEPAPIPPQAPLPTGNLAPMSGFVLNVEEGLKGERIYRYTLNPGANLEGCFKNVRRRIGIELEDGLTVQMCLEKS